MSKIGSSANEFYVKCPLYTQGLKVCPSSKDRLQTDDVNLLTSHCITEEYKNCSFFVNRNDNEQAA
ncbi:hypothetical protein [Leptospira ilyithenensis]|uniref:Uncharacterized protein n=1 Tax=Leptospira ilyithenensis TaxID=2484901 RepID=A0A4R9LUM4_9LEPT|nr:hypothetical protein [Leptospira ilyithenensis]TGN11139.1 hypothetical protein EHS11_08265 [Leptospira ilyithenensis]